MHAQCYVWTLFRILDHGRHTQQHEASGTRPGTGVPEPDVRRPGWGSVRPCRSPCSLLSCRPAVPSTAIVNMLNTVGRLGPWVTALQLHAHARVQCECSKARFSHLGMVHICGQGQVWTSMHELGLTTPWTTRSTLQRTAPTRRDPESCTGPSLHERKRGPLPSQRGRGTCNPSPLLRASRHASGRRCQAQVQG